jgi:hypothetical protein
MGMPPWGFIYLVLDPVLIQLWDTLKMDRTFTMDLVSSYVMSSYCQHTEKQWPLACLGLSIQAAFKDSTTTLSTTACYCLWFDRSQSVNLLEHCLIRRMVTRNCCISYKWNQTCIHIKIHVLWVLIISCVQCELGKRRLCVTQGNP